MTIFTVAAVKINAREMVCPKKNDDEASNLQREENDNHQQEPIKPSNDSDQIYFQLNSKNLTMIRKTFHILLIIVFALGFLIDKYLLFFFSFAALILFLFIEVLYPCYFLVFESY